MLRFFCSDSSTRVGSKGDASKFTEYQIPGGSIKQHTRIQHDLVGTAARPHWQRWRILIPFSITWGNIVGYDDESTISSATLLKARQGDNDAWSNIWKQYSPRVFRQALRLGISESDAEDITVEVFRKVWTWLDRFSRDESGQSLGAWINRITQNTALDLLKQSCRHLEKLSSGAVQLPERSNESADMSLSPLWLAFWRAQGIVENQCSERAWECFRLSRVAHLPHSEIAAILGMSVTNVSTTANRVFEKIRDECVRQLELADFTIDAEGRLVPRDSLRSS